MFAELDVVIVRALLVPTRSVDGSDGRCRQPRIGDQGTIVHVLDADAFVVESVDASGYTIWLADFRRDELAIPPKAWRFVSEEVSPGVYRATGHGPRGLHVQSTDSNLEIAIADCRAFALRFPE